MLTRALPALTVLALAACGPEASAGDPASSTPSASTMASPHFLGLRTAKYTAPDIAKAKAWYADVLGVQPYFDEPFYVGFNVGGFELGITPDSAAGAKRAEAGVAYWGVGNADSAYARLLKMGATEHEKIQDVGDGVKIGSVWDPFGNVLGVIENPHFKLAP
jgi:predicted enzyme related to lactoylglutathione lyase